jgi:organic hydroperoxide reductase OsmC/OhrA
MLNPAVIVQDKTMIEMAITLHRGANEKCFIANSCNFKIGHEAVVRVLKLEQ